VAADWAACRACWARGRESVGRWVIVGGAEEIEEGAIVGVGWWEICDCNFGFTTQTRQGCAVRMKGAGRGGWLPRWAV